MSILIRGAKMPKSCIFCPCLDKDLQICEVLKRDMDIFEDKLSDCPLVEVPEPHGTLIDADEYEKHLASIANTFARSDAQKSLMGRAIFCLENAPTVIESEEGDEE